MKQIHIPVFLKNLIYMLLLGMLYSPNSLALGRLFMSPEQRSALEKLTPDNQAENLDEQQKPNLLRLNGFVKTLNGRSTIWVNGQNQVKVKPKNAYIQHWISPQHQISVDLQGERIQLRPGQTLDIDNRIIKETQNHSPAIDSTDDNESKLITDPEENSNQTATQSSDNSSALQKISELPALK